MFRIDNYGYQELKYEQDDSLSQSNKTNKWSIVGGFPFEKNFCFLTSFGEVLIDNQIAENDEKFSLKRWKSKSSGVESVTLSTALQKYSTLQY